MLRYGYIRVYFKYLEGIIVKNLGLTVKKIFISLSIFVLLFSFSGGIASASVNKDDEKIYIDKIYIDNQFVTFTTIENGSFHSIEVNENSGITTIVTNKITNEVDVTSTFLDTDTNQQIEETIEESLNTSTLAIDKSLNVSPLAWTAWSNKYNGDTYFENRTYAIVLAMLASALGGVPVAAIPLGGLAAYVSTKKTIYWTKQTRMNPDESGVGMNVRIWTYSDEERKKQLDYKDYTYYHSL